MNCLNFFNSLLPKSNGILFHFLRAYCTMTIILVNINCNVFCDNNTCVVLTYAIVSVHSNYLDLSFHFFMCACIQNTYIKTSNMTSLNYFCQKTRARSTRFLNRHNCSCSTTLQLFIRSIQFVSFPICVLRKTYFIPICMYVYIYSKNYQFVFVNQNSCISSLFYLLCIADDLAQRSNVI